VKLTQMGLELSPELAGTIAESLARHASATKNFLRIDMEDSTLTQVTLDIVRRIHAIPALRGSIGIVIQAYLYRSQADIEQLVVEGIRVRLCKGAYKEPAEVAFPSKSDVDRNYVKLSGILLDSPIYHGLATHDEAMITAAKAFASKHKIDPSHFEFQMLYGVRRDLQRKLMRRLAERPANVLFLAKNFFRN
jgi:proline dehydrogenase